MLVWNVTTSHVTLVKRYLLSGRGKTSWERNTGASWNVSEFLVKMKPLGWQIVLNWWHTNLSSKTFNSRERIEKQISKWPAQVSVGVSVWVCVWVCECVSVGVSVWVFVGWVYTCGLPVTVLPDEILQGWCHVILMWRSYDCHLTAIPVQRQCQGT